MNPRRDWTNPDYLADKLDDESTYGTLGPIPDGQPGHEHQWERLPDPALPLRVRLYAALIVGIVLAAMAYGIWRG